MNIDGILKEVGLSEFSVCNDEAKEYIKKALIEYKNFVDKRVEKDEAYAKLISNLKSFYGDREFSKKERLIINELFDFYRVFVDKIFDVSKVVIVSRWKSIIIYKKSGMLSTDSIDVECVPKVVSDSCIDDVYSLIDEVVGGFVNTDIWVLAIYLPLYYDFNDNRWKSSTTHGYLGRYSGNTEEVISGELKNDVQ